ncbi:hypothetical protein [Mycolicibacterium aubagnense]|nr:hypothetical protein [Mycolicibacterium aubagnense]WGI35914.1 hypothetical protein QDT91_28265 [Mycolicibacterium aubagnense]
MRCFEDGNSEPKDFDCSRLTVSPELQRMFAEAFAKRTAPGSGLRSMASIGDTFRSTRKFTRYLASLPSPPARRTDLRPHHIDGFLAERRAEGSAGTLNEDLRGVKMLLRQLDSWPPDMAVKLAEPHPRPPHSGKRHESYSRAEFQRIASAARTDLRRAAQRIRDHRALLEQYRSGGLDDPTRRLELLDYVERYADVPRRGGDFPSKSQLTAQWVREGGFGGTREIIWWAHLSPLEVSAGAVLLAVLTGQNPYVIMKCPAGHHRTDGDAGGPKAAIVGMRKPRRRSRADMDVALAATPDWISTPDDPTSMSRRDELHTAFGVYMLLCELTASSRRIEGSGRLMVAYCSNGTNGRGIRAYGSAEGWVRPWSRQQRLLLDAVEGAPAKPLEVSLVRLRMTYLELHQKPVAHTEQTLVDDYLGRNRGNLVEYRRVVADALDDQVAKARALPLMSALSAAEVTQAQADPTALASKLSLSRTDVRRMLKGKLDTVMNACIDNQHGPHGDPGQPCRASFMLCLSCPCARALPRHLPVQTLVFDRLAERRHHMTPLAWTTRFALPHAQLSDLLARYDDDQLSAARAATTDTHREIVGRFLNRELDMR